MPIPDHIDILGHFAQGGQMRLTVSTVIGLSPTEVDLLIFGTKGTLRVLQKRMLRSNFLQVIKMPPNWNA